MEKEEGEKKEWENVRKERKEYSKERKVKEQKWDENFINDRKKYKCKDKYKVKSCILSLPHIIYLYIYAYVNKY